VISLLTAAIAESLVDRVLGDESFEVLQYRTADGRRWSDCKVTGFELRIYKGDWVKLRVDVASEAAWVEESINHGGHGGHGGERVFNERDVGYRVNGSVVAGIYGAKVNVSKGYGLRCEAFIHRVLKSDGDLPDSISCFEMVFGGFVLRLEGLLKMSDETVVDCADGVIGPIRYLCAGLLSFERV
jgi:hypothetical protein